MILINEGKLDLLKEVLARLISQHQASSELLLWLAKERSDSFADILGAGSLSRHADHHGTRSVQREKVQPLAGFHP